jgi:hypothetical protein
MPKAILEFDLNDPDDRTAHRQAIEAADALSAVVEFDAWLRSQVKHGEDEVRTKILEEARDKLFQEFADHGVSLNN